MHVDPELKPVIRRKSASQNHWLPLDNSAKIFPAIKTGKLSAVFRISIDLSQPIEPEALQQALQDILPRFPHFAMKLKPGLFWYYLEPNPNTPHVYPDSGHPCRRLYRKDNRGYLFRVLFHESRISLEVFHSLTDGTGALAFLKTLTARYLFIHQGLMIQPEGDILDIDQTPPESEMEDSYRRFARPTHLRQPRRPRAFHISGTLEHSGKINVITASMPLDAIKKLAFEHHVTINDFLVACYIHVFCQIQKAEGRHRSRPVVIAVPINMRRFYPSQTLRNFFLRVMPSIDPSYGEYSFEEILAEVHHLMRVRISEKQLNPQMFNNLRNERALAVRLVPLFIKNRVLKLAYLWYGDSRTTSTLTNVGEVRFPETMKGDVLGLEVMMGPSVSNFINCAAISYENRINLTFSRRIGETIVERLFCTHLVSLGVPVRISSNQG